jgi:hypothetical protein
MPYTVLRRTDARGLQIELPPLGDHGGSPLRVPGQDVGLGLSGGRSWRAGISILPKSRDGGGVTFD